ncbi:hypothetical protein BGZ70_001478 [Mortierella alpina]|uniref:Uncharacterized protein n=1 Tax=Mortierella alpina TaxID=64518 RepID=A0A9P6LY26_MORAP|nr:hypothetical protein BGZ70_001478 [Mortierella alpina]
MKSGVESLRTVLANNPIEPRRPGDPTHDSRPSSTSTSSQGSQGPHPPSHSPLVGRSSIDEDSLHQTATTATTTGTTTTTTSRARSGSWSFLPPSLSGISSHGTTLTATASSSSTSTSAATQQQHNARPTGLTRTGSIADSVTESIKSLGTGLKLGQLAGGLGLTGGSGSSTKATTHSRRGTTDSLDQHYSSSSSSSIQDHPPPRGPYLNSTAGGNGGGSASRSRVWGWTGPDTNHHNKDEEQQNDRGRRASTAAEASDTTVMGQKLRSTETILRTGTRTRRAAQETETLLAKVREQQDVAMERMRRMPQVEKMAQRYQDSWRDIHEHTARNSEKADDAEEILEKVLEICTRHINASVQLAEEAKDLKDLDKSMDEMVSMSENIRRKLVGLERKIQTLEENAEVTSLADWKKSQTMQLEQYMDAKKNELWDKAELLSTRSEQFQKEEAARKLHQYQNQFQTDMERFRRTQEEQQQALLSRPPRTADDDEITPTTTTTTTTTRFVVESSGERAHGRPHSGSAPPRNGSKSRILRVPEETFPVALLASEVLHEEEQRRDKEDLDQFLGPATDSDSKDDDEDDSEDDEDDNEDDDDEDEGAEEVGIENETELSDDGTEEEDEDDDDDDGQEDEDASDEDLDPIAKARKARAMAAAAAQNSGGTNQVTGSGSTISAFSALGRHASPSTVSKS